jgi:hypothetical protein
MSKVAEPHLLMSRPGAAQRAVALPPQHGAKRRKEIER